MANHESAQKRARQTIRRTARNRHLRSTVRTYVKRLREALASGDRAAAELQLKDCVARIDKAVQKGLFHRNTGSRTVSRLSSQVAKL